MSPLTSSARDSHAPSLAECQANAIGPVPIGIAVHVAIEIARALAAAEDRAEAAGSPPHHGVSTAHVLIGYDGAISLVDNTGANERPIKASYRAPEQISGGPLDRRADVFSLGIVLWELLTGTQLFARSDDGATSVAILDEPILDVRTVNPDVAPIVGEVLGAALARDKHARFDNVTAFEKALGGARHSSQITMATAQDIARWISKRVPREGLKFPSTDGMVAVDLRDSVPDLDIPRAPRRSPSVPSGSASPPVPPTSVRSAAAAAFSEVALSAPGQPKAIAFDPGDDDDDFDMQIERNLTISAAQASTGAPERSSLHEARPSGAHRAGSGLELGAPQRLSARSERRVASPDAGLLAKLGGQLLALALLGGAAAALFKVGHRAGGRPVTGFLPHAFDGTSANESGAISLVSLVVAAAIIFIGLRLKPHAWSIIGSGAAMLLLALGMVTVTLASTGENPTPPDGALLVPYVAPFALLLLALGIGGRAGRILGRSQGARRLPGVPLAVIAGALAFVALEVSRLAATM